MNKVFYMIKKELSFLFLDKKNIIFLLFTPVLLIFVNIFLFYLFYFQNIDISILIEQSEFWKINSEKYIMYAYPAYLTIFNKAFIIIYCLLQAVFPFIIGISLLITDKESGVLETLLYMPLTVKQIIVGKIFEIIIPSLLMSFITGSISIFIAIILNGKTGIDFKEWILVIFFVIPSYIFFISSFVILLSARSRNTKSAYQISLFYAFGFYLLFQLALYNGINIVTIQNLVIITIFFLILTITILYVLFKIRIEKILYDIR